MGYTDLDVIHRGVAGQIAPPAWGDQVNDDVAYIKGEAAWTVPTFTNGWGVYPGYAVGFRRVGSLVCLRGAIRNGTVGAAAFTLPAGYRPPFTAVFCVLSNGGFGELRVTPAGAVTPNIGSNVWVSLDVMFSIV